MVDNGELAIRLLDLELSGGGLDAQSVVISGVYDHFADWQTVVVKIG